MGFIPGFIGYILIFISNMILFATKAKPAAIIGLIGWFLETCCLIAFIIVGLNSISYNLPGLSEIILLCTTSGTLIVNIIVLKYRNFAKEGFELRREELINYLKKLPSIYPEMSLKDIRSRMKLDKSNIDNLIKIIEDLIYNGELNAKLIGNRLIFTPPSQTQGNIHNPFSQDYHYPPTTTYSPPPSYYQSKKKYLPLGIVFIIFGSILFMVGIAGFFIFIPIFSQFFIGEILGAVLIALGIGFIKKSQ
jgi:hypothetical protein